MNYTQLSLDQAPDIWTPLRFFISAPLFAIAAVFLLMLAGPDVLHTRWLPQTLAITHLLTLGFISMIMMGAMFQLLPVLAGCTVYRSKINSKIIHGLMVSGVSLFCAGFYTEQPLFIKLSLGLLIPAILLFLILVSIALYRASSKFASAKGMRFSVSALWLALMFGSMLAIGSAWDDIPLLREFTRLHIIWAALGWVFTMVVAISFQVIPMFQVTNEHSNHTKTYFFGLLFFGLFVASVQIYFNFSLTIIFLALSLLIILFSIASIRLLLQRKKRLADAGLYFWLTALLSLILSVLTYNVDSLFSLNLDVLTGFLFIVGFAMSVINGMLFKIVPFLVWLHLNRKLAFTDKGLSAVPTMNEVISRKKMLHQYVLHVGALILTVISFFTADWFFEMAMMAWLLSFSFLFFYLLQAIRLYYVRIKDV